MIKHKQFPCEGCRTKQTVTFRNTDTSAQFSCQICGMINAIELKPKMKKVPLYHCTQPCSNCPYRTDAPLKHWHKEEFQKLIDMEQDYMGKVFMCHKQNGSACIGWLIKQEENNLPSISLRISLSKNNVTREYLDKLNSPAPLFKTLKAMIRANFPQLLKRKQCQQTKQASPTCR